MPRITTSKSATQHKVDLDSATGTLNRQLSAGRALYRCSRHTNLVYGGSVARCPVCDAEGALEDSNEKRLFAQREADRLKSEVQRLRAVNEHSAAMNNAVKEMNGKEKAILRDMAYEHVADNLRQIKPKISRKMMNAPNNMGSYRLDKVVGIQYRTTTDSSWEVFDPETIGGKAFLLPFFESMKVAGTKRTMHHLMISLKHGAVDVDVLLQDDE